MSSYNERNPSLEDPVFPLDAEHPGEIVDGIAQEGSFPESPEQEPNAKVNHAERSAWATNKDLLAQGETLRARLAMGYRPGNDVGA